MTNLNKLLITFVVLGVLFLNISESYNSMVRQDEAVNTAWSQVETQYQRRFDLIPNLTTSAKSVLTQERALIDSVTEARKHYSGTQPGTSERVEATSGLESALGRLLVVMENYPQLQSDRTVIALMDELAGTENRVGVSRQRYNEVAQKYNTKIRSFPTNILAGMFGFEKKLLFKSSDGADQAPEVHLEIEE